MKRSFILCLILTVCMVLPVATAVSADDTDVSGTVPLSAYDIAVSSIGNYGATISWKTNGDATSQVFYDTEFHEDIADYADETIEDTDLVSEHSIPLTGLSSSTTYHFRVRAAIPGTEFLAISEDYTFRTLTPSVGPGAPAYYLRVDLWGEKFKTRVTSAGKVRADLEAVSIDEKVTLYIAKGVLAQTEDEKRVKKIIVLPMEESPPAPKNGYIIGIAYDFTPAGATFDPPMELEIRYDPSILPADVAEKDLLIAYYDEEANKWLELDSTVDTVSNTVTAEVDHLTPFTIIGYEVVVAPAAFTITELIISPAEVNIGQGVTITAIVTNTGGEVGIYEVVLEVDGVVEDTKKVVVSAGASKKVTFTTAKDVAGSYSINVNGLSGSFTVKAAPPVTPAPAPTPPPTTPEAEPAVDWTLIGAIIAGVVVVGLGIFFWIRRRRER
ncbi:hypothetical protein ES703_85278 [subsurface metagenome]